MKRSVPSTCILLNAIVTFERIQGEQGERFGDGSVFPPILQRLITAKMLAGKWLPRIDLHPIRNYPAEPTLAAWATAETHRRRHRHSPATYLVKTLTLLCMASNRLVPGRSRYSKSNAVVKGTGRGTNVAFYSRCVPPGPSPRNYALGPRVHEGLATW